MLTSEPAVSRSSRPSLQTSTRPAGNAGGDAACDHEVSGRRFESLFRLTFLPVGFRSMTSFLCFQISMAEISKFLEVSMG